LSDGTFLVGRSVEPGLFTSSGPDPSDTLGCSYNWSTNAGSGAEMRGFKYTHGPATVELKADDIFTSDNCGVWSKAG
jgi:hypothetical protein